MFVLGWLAGCLAGTILGSWWTSKFIKVGEVVSVVEQQPKEPR